MTEFEVAVKAAVARYEALSSEQKRVHRRAQQRSWVIGEMLLEHPTMTREYVEHMLDGAGL